MIGGTPGGVDKSYQKAHPDWRYSYHKTRESILAQMLADREACARFQTADGRWIPASGLSYSELSEYADQRARVILERAIRQNKEPAIELR